MKCIFHIKSVELFVYFETNMTIVYARKQRFTRYCNCVPTFGVHAFCVLCSVFLQDIVACPLCLEDN